MSSIFCCSSITPYRPRHLNHESKFRAFMQWAKQDLACDRSSLVPDAPYAIQVVKQVNYGPQESIRYFVPRTLLVVASDSAFEEATEDTLLTSNFEKVNSYKNFRCAMHNKFFELNLYQKNATGAHHDDDDDDDDDGYGNPWTRRELYNYDRYRSYSFGFGDSDGSPGNNFAACDRECGYCVLCEIIDNRTKLVL